MVTHSTIRFCGLPFVMGGLVLAAAAPVYAEDPKPDAPASAAPHPRVRLTTSVGDIVIELFQDKSPVSVENFLQYVGDSFYDGVAFHRVKADFMIQTGGYNADLSERTNGLRPPIKNESANLLKNERGTVAMARLGDPHSATSQFFINVADNPHLDRTKRQPYGYAVFGRVVVGMEVVDRIQRARTIQHPRDPRKGADGPVNPDPPITIKRATVMEPAAADMPAPEAGSAADAVPSPDAVPAPNAVPAPDAPKDVSTDGAPE